MVAVIKLTLAYDGTDFRGWARQPHGRTVEAVLQASLEKLFRRTVGLSVAGRTDAGVHAEGQVASFPAPEVPREIDPIRLQRAINGMLAPEVVVREIRAMADPFDARHSATGRDYVYRMDTGPFPDPFTARFVWHRPGRLGLRSMRDAAGLLEGTHDFMSFCRAPKGGESTVRSLERLAISARGDRVQIRASAPSFLHQMVRSLVGTLVNVGQGKIEAGAMAEILARRSRQAAGAVAPPHGLALVRVRYGRRGLLH